MKASVTPTEMPCDSVSLVISATMLEVLSAVTRTSPAVVVRLLSETNDCALLRTVLVAIRKFSPLQDPLSVLKGLQPSIRTLLASRALIAAVSAAATVMPVAAVTSCCRISAVTPPRTSLRTASAPTPMALEAVTLSPRAARNAKVSPTTTLAQGPVE